MRHLIFDFPGTLGLQQPLDFLSDPLFHLLRSIKDCSVYKCSQTVHYDCSIANKTNVFTHRGLAESVRLAKEVSVFEGRSASSQLL